MRALRRHHLARIAAACHEGGHGVKMRLHDFVGHGAALCDDGSGYVLIERPLEMAYPGCSLELRRRTFEWIELRLAGPMAEARAWCGLMQPTADYNDLYRYFNLTMQGQDDLALLSQIGTC